MIFMAQKKRPGARSGAQVWDRGRRAIRRAQHPRERFAITRRALCHPGRIGSLQMCRIATAFGSKIFRGLGQQPLALTRPQPNSVLRDPGPRVSTPARKAARIAALDRTPRAICRATSAVTIGVANEVPLT